LLKPQKVAPNAKSCSKGAEHNRDRPSYENVDREFVNQMLRSLYVDDLSLSFEDVDKAYELYLNSRERMAQGGFNLRKWLTNSRPLVEKIKEMESHREPSKQTEKGNQLNKDDGTYNRIIVSGLKERDVNTEQKVLGTNWNYFTDEFLFKFQPHVERAQGLLSTKQNILIVIASFYDPMGLISPIIVQMKILF